MTVLMNTGQRTFHLREGKDKDGKPVKRSLPPGGSIEALDAAEAEYLLGYKHEIVDAEKAVKPVADQLAALRKEKADLVEEIAGLKERLAKYEPSVKEDKKGKK